MWLEVAPTSASPPSFSFSSMVFAGGNMLCDYRAKVVRDLEILVFMSMADVLQLERTTCLGLCFCCSIDFIDTPASIQWSFQISNRQSVTATST